jgi:RNA polymerase sigma-70 factor (ECF subfamily)
MKHFSEYSDEQLVTLVLSDEAAFVEIVNRYEAKLRRYISRISAFPDEEIEEILQDVFLSVWKNLRGFDTRIKFSSWIYRIAHNQTISLFRKFKSRGREQEEELTSELFIPVADDFASHVDAKIDAELIQTALAEMPEKYREILVLRFFEDLSCDEIADVLRCSVGTVSTLVSRARKKFHSVVDELHISFSK